MWKRITNNLCPYCHEIETVKHIYFECNRMKDIWNLVGNILQIDIKWKNIILGYKEGNVHSCFRNILICTILFAVFKFWMNGLENENSYISATIRNPIKNEIVKWKNILSCISAYKALCTRSNTMWTIVINVL